VQQVFSKMREGASPGALGIPIAVWKALPDEWMAAVARLLNMVEDEGVWPAEWLDAYITMIPKASGGTRPRDQRPITVMDVLYRLWSKGLVLEWTPVLQQAYLGQAAMGFRAQAGTLHVAQLLADLIVLQERRGQELWLASFDIEKCYDSLPWWAIFGVMRRTGMEPRVVAAFEAFYRQLRRRFRYGQVDGAVCTATNSLAQGCPASPDLLNLLFEPFHRWALAQGFGVEVAGCRIPSTSFADDLALVASSLAEMERLVAAYLQWCELLGIRVTKVQAWSNTGRTQWVRVAATQVDTSPTFKIVGVVLGRQERVATELHVTPRLVKAMETLRRLRALELPAALCSLLWRTTVLPQALYGCEVRDVRPTRLVPLASAGKSAIAAKFPLKLNTWRAPEVLTGPPLGESAVQDPVLEMRDRQLRWLHLLVNLPGLVGTVHRAIAWRTPTWEEPTTALREALRAVGWSVGAICNACERRAGPFWRRSTVIRAWYSWSLPTPSRSLMQCSRMAPCPGSEAAQRLFNRTRNES
jgi:hypothetical protein